MNWALRCGPYIVLIFVALVALVALVSDVARGALLADLEAPGD